MKKISKKILYLPIETTTRELESKIYLATKAYLHGYDVVLGRKPYVKKIAEKIGGGFFLSKDTVKYKKSEFELCEENMLFIELHEEGLVRFHDEDLFDLYPENVKDYHDLIFTWGTKQKKLFLNRFNFPEKKVFVTGNPRFDILNWNILKKIPENKQISSLKPFILVATNFSRINRSNYYKETLADQKNYIKKKIGKKISSQEIREINEFTKIQSNMLEEYIDLVKNLCSDFNDYYIIVRPHPSENFDFWRKKFESIPNVRITSKGNTKDWIASSVFFIHSGSTTGIESHYLNKPTFLYLPIKNYKVPPLTESVSNTKETYKDLKKSISDIEISRTQYESQHNKYLSTMLENYNGSNSSEIIISVLNKYLLQDNKAIYDRNIPRKFVGAFIKYYFIYIQNIVNIKWLPLNQRLRGLLVKYPKLDNSDVLKLFTRFVELNDENTDKAVMKELAPDTYYFSSKGRK